MGFTLSLLITRGMASSPSKSFNLPLLQYDQYWVCVYAKVATFSPPLAQALTQAGMHGTAPNVMVIKTAKDWQTQWASIYQALIHCTALDMVEVAVLPGDTQPPPYGMGHKPVPVMQDASESLWLGEALLEDRVHCYMQQVVSARDKIFGYESFARVRAHDGTVIGGDKIIAASKALNIEYMIDRHLQVQAIKTFAASDFNGFLFVNFFPGFIHLPAVYLEGLGETVRNFGIVAKHIVLDFTKSETPRDIAHLKSVCQYGRTRGYSIALDDIGSMESSRKLVPEIRPDFVKIDMHLARKVSEPAKRDLIRQIVEFVHSTGGMVIGEGVETEEVYLKLKELGVDLFQGYYFSPPVPVEAAIRKSTGT